MIVAGLQKLSLIDYPGKLAATVFLAGCNFSCPWCYSSELVSPEKIKKQPKILEKDFFNFLEDRKGLLEAVTICGGEPTINKGLPKFIKKIKKLGYLIKIDTNGSNPRMLKELIAQKLIDYVAMDIKAPLGLKSQIPNPKFQNKLKKTVELLKNSRINFEFRTTVVPTVHTKEDILKIAKWIRGPKVKYYLQNFRPEKTIDLEFEKIKPYPQEYLLEIQKSISPFFDVCQVR